MRGSGNDSGIVLEYLYSKNRSSIRSLSGSSALH